VVAPQIIAALGAFAIFCFVLSFAPAPNSLAKRLQRLEGIREPSLDRRNEMMEKILAAENRSRLQRRLNSAGMFTTSPAALATRGLAWFAAGLAVSVVLFIVLPIKPVALLLGVFIAALAWRMPKIAVDRTIKARREQIARTLPDFLDLLAATVRAGLALNGALAYAAGVTTGALAEELGAMLSEVRLGRSRVEALQAMAARVDEPQLKTVVTTIAQADRLGSNLALVLHEIAVDARNQRWTTAEERAAQLPIKMIFPMALLMLPSLYVMIFTPVLAQFLSR
jgi:tight adherence protein C